MGMRSSVGVSKFFFGRELFAPFALFFRGITILKTRSCFVVRSSCLLPVNGMMEEELVSEKDVLLLQTGFLKCVINYIKHHLLISVKINIKSYPRNFILVCYLTFKKT